MQPSHTGLKGKAFLAIDMDEKLLNGVQRYLVADGARSVFTTEFPQHAIDILQTVNPPVDCIICAEDLAPFTGIELLKSFRCGKYGEAPHVRGVKFILLTAHRELALVEAGKALDVDGYIVKPIQFASFITHVHQALAHTRELKPHEDYLKVDISDAVLLPIASKKK